MQQIWRDVLDYEGLYQVSNLGRVKSLNYNHTRKEKILKNSINIRKLKSRNYKRYFIGLCKNGKRKTFFISRLVFQAFKGKISSGYQIDHINNDSADNRLQNLQLLTSSENCKKRTIDNPNLTKSYKHYLQKLNPPKKVLCLNNGIVYDSISEAERRLDIFHSNICNVLKGRYKHTNGYVFCYVDETNNDKQLIQLQLF